jgi:hypothetical protein
MSIRPIFKANGFLMDAIGGCIENLHIGEATVMPAMNLYLAWARGRTVGRRFRGPDHR